MPLYRTTMTAWYGAQGSRAEAASLYRRSLTILEISLGPDHRDVAASLNNLAMLLDSEVIDVMCQVYLLGGREKYACLRSLPQSKAGQVSNEKKFTV